MKKILSAILSIAVIASTVAAFGMTASAKIMSFSEEISETGASENWRLKKSEYESEYGNYVDLYEYDGKNRVIAESCGSSETDLASKFLTEYDANGNVSKKEYQEYDEESSTFKTYSISEFTYNSDNTLDKEVQKYKNESGSFYDASVVQFTYVGGLNTKTKITSYNESGDVKETVEYSYEYDSDGSMTEEVRVTRDASDNVTDGSKAEYGTEGSTKILKDYYLDVDSMTYVLNTKYEGVYEADGTPDTIKTYGYTSNPAGELCGIEEYNEILGGFAITMKSVSDGEEIETFRYEYALDEYGNITEIKDFIWNQDDCVWDLYSTYTRTYFEIQSAEPEIVQGDGQTVDVTMVTFATFASDAAASEFVKVTVDGKDVAANYYTLGEETETTVIKLNEAFLATLGNGAHTISIVSTSGSADCAFTVAGQSGAAQTGDGTTIVLWTALIAASSLAILAISKRRKSVTK